MKNMTKGQIEAKIVRLKVVKKEKVAETPEGEAAATEATEATTEKKAPAEKKKS